MDDCVSKFDWDKLLAACFVRDTTTGQIKLNCVFSGYIDCNAVEQVIACGAPAELEQLIKSAITLDDCGRPALNVTGFANM